MQAKNLKLRERAVLSVMAETNADEALATAALEACGWKIPGALERLKTS